MKLYGPSVEEVEVVVEYERGRFLRGVGRGGQDRLFSGQGSRVHALWGARGAPRVTSLPALGTR